MAVMTTTLLAAGALVASAAGTAVAMQAASQQADAQKQAANAQAQQLRYQAQVANNNQIVANQNAAAQDQAAQATRDAANVQAQTRLMQAGQQTATIRAAAGASGVDPNSGSSVALQSDAEKLGTLDALTIRSNAERTAYADEVGAISTRAQGSNYAAEATLDNMGADNAIRAGNNAIAAGNISATSSLLSGASSVSSKWAMYQQNGTFSGGGGSNPMALTNSVG